MKKLGLWETVYTNRDKMFVIITNEVFLYLLVILEWKQTKFNQFVYQEGVQMPQSS